MAGKVNAIRSSKKVATIASRILRSGGGNRAVASLAGGGLVNRKKRTK